MARPHWPLFDLVVRTPTVELRYLDDDLGERLASLASRGIHDPAFMPFAVPWTDRPSPELERDALRFYWRSRATTQPESWNLLFAVLVGGEVVGSTNLGAEQFPTRRWFETGSWLGREFQRRGIGTEMRVATLQLGFVGFGAEVAGTGAVADNAASLGVTAKLGYEPNGIDHVERRGEVAVIHKFRMTRDHFVTNVKRDDIEITSLAGARELLGLDERAT
jgi:RimJ/RimL family protein N-acetyltransferase